MKTRLGAACALCAGLLVPVLASAQAEVNDWSNVQRSADLDSLLMDGQGIVLAFEDTFSFDPGSPDTVLVSAPRVTVEDVIAAIGRRMEYDNYRMADVEYTTLITQVVREQPGVEGGDYQVEEYALRYHQDGEKGEQVVKLWERSRKFENFEMVEEETDEEMKAEFLPNQGQIIESMPFSSGGAGRYNYTILDRQMVGNNLIYKIGFEPKSRFEALPSGTIWVDYSNWVLRKIEARMTGAVPYPMFLKSVPVYRLSQERFGEFWFPTEAYMRINLRKVPLLPIPDNIEVRVSLRDIVINGEPRSPQDTAPGAGMADISAEDIAAGFWLSEEANNDSLSAYWGEIGEEWAEDMTSEAIPVSLSAAKVDSLSNEGTAELLELREGGVWRVEQDLVTPPSFNRAQGFAPRLGLALKKLGPDNPRLDLTAGYAFSNKRPVFGAELELPLVRSRWNLAHPKADGHEYRGAQYQLLAFRMAGRKDSALFAGDGRRHTRSASAFFYGSDPNNYYEERGFDGDLHLRLSRGLVLRAGGGYAEHRSWRQRTSWNVLGRSLRPDGNLAADYLDDSFLRAGLDWQWGALSLDGDVTWHELQDTAGLEVSRREIRVSGALDLLDKFGNQWLLRGTHREFDDTAPVQWKTWLGDYGTLRGFGAGELTGDAGAHASLDGRFGFDLWRAARVPVLKNWGLQPIGFVDWGKTWDRGGDFVGSVDSAEGARDWRMDVGFGFGKRFDLPGLGEFRNVRLYAAHPVAET
ncbi:MAG: BamA/TamA family outer membrane protein, partial [Candidatus Krumholzibacteria bacterium]|nr:BamA/TamA family outer membrane protein [Candidatus Krumholzibacteria bacterium]